jgi:phage terminase large subunit-like protein
MEASMTPTSTLDLAALQYAWEYHARPKQMPPPTAWKSWGIISGRGWGKTRSCAELTVSEVMAGRVKRIAFCSFNLDEAERTLIHGQSGLIAVSPPWFKPTVNKGIVCWPNGAIATPYTPEVPAGPRGPESDWLWCSEAAAWPASTRDEFFSNLRLGNRLPGARMIFDTTPRRRDPIVRYFLERAARDPRRHLVVRGATRDNGDNLDVDFVTSLEAEIGGTMRGRAELEGLYDDDADGALWKQEWIDAHRRDMPTVLKRRIISIDPAISTRKGTDATGLVEMGVAPDDQVVVISDHTDHMAAGVWGAKVIELYVRNGCDCVIVERNRGCDLVVENLRACAERRGIRVEKVERDAKTRRDAGTVYVKEVHARNSKHVRAEPVASLYERGRVSHVRGADLADLEESLCTWTPESNGESPNALDALVHGCVELADLSRDKPHRSDVIGAAKLQASIGKTPTKAPNIATLLGGGRGGDRI